MAPANRILDYFAQTEQSKIQIANISNVTEYPQSLKTTRTHVRNNNNIVKIIFRPA